MNADTQLHNEKPFAVKGFLSLVMSVAVALGGLTAGVPATAQPAHGGTKTATITSTKAPAQEDEATDDTFHWGPHYWEPPQWLIEWWEEQERQRQQPQEPDYPEDPQAEDQPDFPEQEPLPEDPNQGEDTEDGTEETEEPEAPEQPAPRGSISALFSTLEIHPADRGGRYSRSQFGKAWADVDGNYCSTRNDILARDLTNIRRDRNCRVLSGDLLDPYTGKFIRFKAGRDTSSAVQIDHVVALRDAWETGAQNLDKEIRTHFANDPLNLLAVDGPANTAKGHKNAAKWLPPRHAFRCHYIARQIAVKARYHLWVTDEEHRALANGLQHCPSDMRVEHNTIVGAGA